MTEEELKNLMKEGKVEVLDKPEEEPLPEEEREEAKLEDYIVSLEQLRRGEVGGDIVLTKSGAFTNSLNITGLDGNQDGFYLLFIKARHSSSFPLHMRFNGDSGANYHMLKHNNSRQSGTNFHGVENVSNMVEMRISFITQNEYLAKVLIYAKSGAVRQVKSECFGWTGWATFCDDSQSSFIWTNATDNITTINLITGAITAGEYKLYKLK